eukprot:GEMP01020354.1.p1 GENE.GEMP01020354.1~~GEMP01020354.1.p1  ORF type:complete len:528 (+),score=83.77 GEMP01020354.1:302-1885(+)
MHLCSRQKSTKAPRFVLGVVVAILPLLSTILYLFCRCPVYCQAIGGGYYSRYNVGIMSPGPGTAVDVVTSIVSLILGICGVLGTCVAIVVTPPPASSSRRYMFQDGVFIASWRRCLKMAFVVAWFACGLFNAYRICLALQHTLRVPGDLSSNQCSVAPSSEVGRNYTFGIVSILTPSLRDSSVRTCVQETQKRYAAAHGYELFTAESGLLNTKNDSDAGDYEGLWAKYPDVLPSRPSSSHYEKLGAILVTLEKRPDIDWVLWLDFDAIIMNGEYRLQDLVPTSESADFVISMVHESGPALHLKPGQWSKVLPSIFPYQSTSGGRFNSGAFLIRNSVNARAILRDVLSLPVWPGDDDQNMLGQRLFRSVNDVPDAAVVMQDGVVRFPDGLAVRIVGPRCMNAHPGSWSPWGRYMTGDFVMHSWGGGSQGKLSMLQWGCEHVARIPASEYGVPQGARVATEALLWTYVARVSVIVFACVVACNIKRILSCADRDVHTYLPVLPVYSTASRSPDDIQPDGLFLRRQVYGR